MCWRRQAIVELFTTCSTTAVYCAKVLARLLILDGFPTDFRQAFPDFLAETNYQDIPDPANIAAQKAFGISLFMFGWLPS